MMRSYLLALAALAMLVGGCIVHHHPRHKRHQSGVAEQPAPAPEGTEPVQPAPPPREGGESTTHRAPPAPAAPQMTVTLDRSQASPGQEVTLFLSPFDPAVMVYFGGRPLPKKVQGNSIRVTVPSGVGSGHFEVEWNGQRFRSPYLTVQ